MNTRLSRLENMAHGYRDAQVLFVACRLGIFECLARQKQGSSVEELSRRVQTDPRGTRILCDALTALGLLSKREKRYSNSTLAREYLLPGSPRDQRALLLHGASLYEHWARLCDVVQTGKPAARDRVDPRLRGGEREFAEAMASSGRLGARETATKAGLAHARTMLDVGGGPGVYAIEFARRYPRLRVVVFDDAKTLRVARENIARARLSRRISVRAGDAFRDDLRGPYDFVLLSNIVHCYSDEDNKRLLARAAKALTPGGLVGIKDFILNPTHTGPRGASLFAVNMLVNTNGGDCYSAGEIKAWFDQAGLRFKSRIALRPPSELLLAARPGSRPPPHNAGRVGPTGCTSSWDNSPPRVHGIRDGYALT